MERIIRCHRRRVAEYTLHELEAIPAHLRDIAAGSGYEWYLSPTAQFLSFIGAVRSPVSRSCVNWPSRRVFLIGEHERENGFSVVHHEFAHAIDEALGLPSSRLSFRGQPLDWYAALNPAERFAQAFAAYVTPDRADCPWYAVHTQAELRKREPDLYQFIAQLARLPV